VALAEFDRQEDAIDLLESLRTELSEMFDPKRDPQAALIISAIDLQLALRYFEVEDRLTVLEIADRVKSTLSTRPSYDVVFETSAGNLMTPSGILRELRATIRARATLARARAEQFSGRSWLRVARSRPTYTDTKIEFAAARRDQAALRDVFEQRIEAHSGKIVLGRTDAAIDNGYAALLQAQLGGDLSDSFRFAEELGKVLAVRRERPTVNEAAEVLRLFRQSRAGDSLNSYLRWLRAGGPLQALSGAAIGIIRRDSFPNRLNEYDLRLLAETGDLLDWEDADEALRGVLEHAVSPKLAQPAYLDKVWLALARLLSPESQLTWQIGAAAADAILSGPPVLPSTSGAVAAVLGVVGPDAFTSIARAKLAEWAAAQQRGEDQDLARAVFEALREPVADDDLEGAELASWLVESPESGTRSQLDRAVHWARDAIAAVRDRASKGTTAMGGADEIALGALLLRREPDPELAEQIVQAIVDTRVAPVLKTNAFRILAQGVDFSEDQDLLLKATRAEWSDPGRDPFLGRSNAAGVYAEALMFSAARQYIDRDDAIETVMSLAGSEDSGAVRSAVQLVPAIAKSFDEPQWSHFLLLQLSRHHDPTVVAQAGRSLVEVSRLDSSVSGMIQRRIRELLAADGVRVPLFVIHGYQYLRAEERRSLEGWERQLVARLAEAHMSRVVRLAALEALREQSIVD